LAVAGDGGDKVVEIAAAGEGEAGVERHVAGPIGFDAEVFTPHGDFFVWREITAVDPWADEDAGIEVGGWPFDAEDLGLVEGVVAGG
jgi:hypothetical protein